MTESISDLVGQPGGEVYPPAPEGDAPYNPVGSALGGIDWSHMNRPTGEATAGPPEPMSEKIGDVAQEGLTKLGMKPQVAEHMRQGIASLVGFSNVPTVMDLIEAKARGDNYGVIKNMVALSKAGVLANLMPKNSPFGQSRAPAGKPPMRAAPKLVPVDHDPFETGPDRPKLVPVDYDPFAGNP